MAGEAPEYARFVRGLPCCVCSRRPVEAHHAGERGLGKRAHDETCIPLCREHHAAWHDAGPPFRGMTKEQRRAWSEAAIGATGVAYAGSLLPAPFPF